MQFFVDAADIISHGVDAHAKFVGNLLVRLPFRQTVDQWIGRGIVADLYIAPAANEILGPRAFVPPDLLPALEEDPAVRAVDTYREVTARTEAGDLVKIGAVRGADSSAARGSCPMGSHRGGADDARNPWY